ncbi:MAG: hypothetical protein ACK59C_05230, partial [Holosporales bacterium]
MFDLSFLVISCFLASFSFFFLKRRIDDLDSQSRSSKEGLKELEERVPTVDNSTETKFRCYDLELRKATNATWRCWEVCRG